MEDHKKSGDITKPEGNAAIKNPLIQVLSVNIQDLIPDLDMNNLQTMSGKPGVSFYINNKTQTYNFRKYDDPFADLIYYGGHFRDEQDKQEAQEMRKKLEILRGQIVIDIGAGKHSFGYRIAQRAGAKAYIGVEAINYKELVDILSFEITQQSEGAPIPAIVIGEDMCNFLKRIPDDSVSIFCSGIDRTIIKDLYYWEATGREILRVLNRQGAYIGNTVGGHIGIESDEIIWEMNNRIIIHTKK